MKITLILYKWVSIFRLFSNHCTKTQVSLSSNIGTSLSWNLTILCCTNINQVMLCRLGSLVGYSTSCYLVWVFLLGVNPRATSFRYLIREWICRRCDRWKKAFLPIFSCSTFLLQKTSWYCCDWKNPDVSSLGKVL